MPYSLNMNASQIEAARLEYPKIAARQEVYRYYGVFTGTTGGEIFIDGNSSRRLQLPVGCAATVNYDLVAYEFNTSTGAFVAGAAASGGRFGATNNNGTVAAIANAVAPTLMPTAQTIATVTVAANDTLDAITFTVAVAGGGAATTKVVEIVAFVNVANRAPAIAGIL